MGLITSEKKKRPYFSMGKAYRLIRCDLCSLDDKKLQLAIVTLRDYKRYVGNTELYFGYLIEGGWFVSATTQASIGYCPKDMWLGENIRFALERALKERDKRLTDCNSGNKGE